MLLYRREGEDEREGPLDTLPTEVAPPPVLSMTDEEGDLEAFRDYLGTVPPDSLWDILHHLDEEQFPRRAETVRREIGRRRLFFVSPYTVFESRLRTLFFASVGFALLAATLHALSQVEFSLEPGEHLSWFFDLAVGTPAAARLMLPAAQFALVTSALLTLGAVVVAAWRLARHRLRRDVLVQGLIAVGLIAAFGAMAGLTG